VRKAVKKKAAKKKAKSAPAKAKSKSKASSKARKSARKSPKKPETLKQKRARFRQKVGGKVAVIDSVKDPEGVIKTFIPTGSLALDRMLKPDWSDVGGIPSGGITEIVGEHHIGKSTLADHIMANCQRKGGIAVLLETDAERDWFYTRKTGVDIDELERVEFPETDDKNLENVMDIATETTRFWREEAPDVPVVIVLDALGVTPTREEVEKSLSKGSTASAAKILRKACRRISALLAGSNIAFVILNHEYEAISFMGAVKPKKAYGGEAIALLALVRLRMHRVMDGWLKRGDGVRLGRKVGIDLVKFKRGHAFRECQVPILTGEGIDNTWSIWERLTAKGIIAVGGNNWGAINIDGEVIKFQGPWGLRDKCYEHPDLLGKLVQVYREVV